MNFEDLLSRMDTETENYFIRAEDARLPNQDDFILKIEAKNQEDNEEEAFFEERFTLKPGWQREVSVCLNVRGFDEVDEHLFGENGKFEGTFERF